MKMFLLRVEKVSLGFSALNLLKIESRRMNVSAFTSSTANINLQSAAHVGNAYTDAPPEDVDIDLNLMMMNPAFVEELETLNQSTNAAMLGNSTGTVVASVEMHEIGGEMTADREDVQMCAGTMHQLVATEVRRSSSTPSSTDTSILDDFNLSAMTSVGASSFTAADLSTETVVPGRLSKLATLRANLENVPDG